MSILDKTKEKIVKFADAFIHPRVTGLDISDRSIKYLKFYSRARGKLSFGPFGEISIPEGLIVDGEIKKETEMINLLRSWSEKEGRELAFSPVAVSLPEEKSFLRLVQLPKVERENIGNAIRWEMEANIPLPAEELIFDYEITESLDGRLDHLDIMIVAFPKSIVDSYVRVLKGGGFTPVVLELESQAVTRVVIPNLGDKAARIIVDMGRQRTGLNIFAGGALVFTTTLGIGGQLIEESIARELGVTKEEAEKIKKDLGMDKKEFGGKLFSAILPEVSAIASEIKKASEYYQNHVEHLHGINDKVDEVLLVGGDANLLGLPTYFSSALAIPVRLADALGVIKDKLEFPPIPPLAPNRLLIFAPAMGLALRGFN